MTPPSPLTPEDRRRLMQLAGVLLLAVGILAAILIWANSGPNYSLPVDGPRYYLADLRNLAVVFIVLIVPGALLILAGRK